MQVPSAWRHLELQVAVLLDHLPQPGPWLDDGHGRNDGGCPMMGGTNGMDPKTAMRMHAEMMRAMSDIMLKYSDQAGTALSK